MIEALPLIYKLIMNPVKITPIRYYEPGKACYIEGTFYEQCPEMPWRKRNESKLSRSS